MANVLITGKRYSDRTIVDEIRTTSDGVLISKDYGTAVAQGEVTSAQPYSSYGELVTIGAVTNQIIWPAGTYLLPPPAGVQMSLVSTSANDTAAGTGIRSVDIHYLDNLLAEQTETVVLNGLTPVLTVATNIRFIQCLHMATFGSGKVAAGLITASNGGTTYAQITAGSVRCSSSVRMVPAGKRLYVNGLVGGSSSGTAAASAIIRLCATAFDGHDYAVDSVFIPLAAATAQDTSISLSLNTPMSFEAGTAVGLQVTVDKAATVVGAWFGWLGPV